MKINALSDLKQVKKAIEAQAAREAALAAHKAAEAKRKAAASNLFQAAIGKVKPLEPPQRAKLTPEPPKPIPKQQMLDDAAALQEALSDEIDVTTLLDTDEHLSFRRPGVGTDVTQKLRKGKWSIQKQIDLHGYRSDALENLGLGAEVRQSIRPGLIDIALDAYGHSGPWAARRGFDAPAGKRFGSEAPPYEHTDRRSRTRPEIQPARPPLHLVSARDEVYGKRCLG